MCALIHLSNVTVWPGKINISKNKWQNLKDPFIYEPCELFISNMIYLCIYLFYPPWSSRDWKQQLMKVTHRVKWNLHAWGAWSHAHFISLYSNIRRIHEIWLGLRPRGNMQFTTATMVNILCLQASSASRCIELSRASRTVSHGCSTFKQGWNGSWKKFRPLGSTVSACLSRNVHVCIVRILSTFYNTRSSVISNNDAPIWISSPFCGTLSHYPETFTKVC